MLDTLAVIAVVFIIMVDVVLLSLYYYFQRDEIMEWIRRRSADTATDVSNNRVCSGKVLPINSRSPDGDQSSSYSLVTGSSWAESWLSQSPSQSRNGNHHIGNNKNSVSGQIHNPLQSVLSEKHIEILIEPEVDSSSDVIVIDNHRCKKDHYYKKELSAGSPLATTNGYSLPILHTAPVLSQRYLDGIATSPILTTYDRITHHDFNSKGDAAHSSTSYYKGIESILSIDSPTLVPSTYKNIISHSLNPSNNDNTAITNRNEGWQYRNNLELIRQQIDETLAAKRCENNHIIAYSEDCGSSSSGEYLTCIENAHHINTNNSNHHNIVIYDNTASSNMASATTTADSSPPCIDKNVTTIDTSTHEDTKLPSELGSPLAVATASLRSIDSSVVERYQKLQTVTFSAEH